MTNSPFEVVGSATYNADTDKLEDTCHAGGPCYGDCAKDADTRDDAIDLARQRIADKATDRLKRLIVDYGTSNNIERRVVLVVRGYGVKWAALLDQSRLNDYGV